MRTLDESRGAGAVSERDTYAKVSRRILPFLFLCYIFAYIDRVNVGFAKLQMQHDLNIGDAAYGTGAGIFFIGYFLFEIPCNIALQKIGARRWLGPIIIVWGLISASTMLVKTAGEFYTVRFILGVVESGFFPGVVLYLTFWFPSRYRAKMVAIFMTAIPLSGVLGGPISGWLLDRMSTVGALRGWQWLFILEGIPSMLAGLASLFFLPDGPKQAKWLTADERTFLSKQLEEDRLRITASGNSGHSFGDAFRSGKVWALCFIYFGFVMGNYGLSFWLPQIVKDTLTKDSFSIGLLTAIPWGAAAIAMVLVGHHSDATGERCWHIAIPGLIGTIAFAASAAPGISGVTGLIALTIATAGIASAYSTFWSLPTAFVTGTAASAGIAWINSVGNLGGYVSPVVVGKIRDTTHSTPLALMMLAAACAMSTLLTVLLFRQRAKTE